MKKTKLSLILFSLAMIASISFSSCKKDDTDKKDDIPTNTPVNENDISTSKFTATIDGANISYIDGVNNISGSCGTSKLIGDSTTIVYDYSIGGTTNVPFAEIRKGTLVSLGSTPSTTLFNSYFTVGSCNFSDNAVNGIQIRWANNANETWTTSGTSQTGSSFSFTVINYTDTWGSHYACFKATFNCKLTNGSTVKTLTNGTLIGGFENQ